MALMDDLHPLSNFTYDYELSQNPSPRLNFSFGNLSLDFSNSYMSHEAFTKNTQYFIISVYCLATFLSLLGNITVIIILSCGKRTSIRCYLINLAVSDLTMASFCIPFSYTNFMYNHWIFWPEFCGVVMFLQHVSVTSSVYTLVAIGVDRYKALVYPLNERWTKTRAPVVIATIWGFSILMSVVQLVVSYSEQLEWNGQTYYICRENWPYTQHAVYEKIYTIVVFVVTFGLPVLSLGYTYVSIVAMMCTYRLPGNAEPTRDQQRLQAKIKVINMMITVMVCFVLCWFPIHILQIIIYFAPSVVQCRGQDGCFSYYVSFFVCHWVAMSNSFMNPIIYCFMSKNFRDDFVHIVVKCRQSRLRRNNSEIRSRSDVGSSFRSILYITHRTSVHSSTRASLKSRFTSKRDAKDTVEMKVVQDKKNRVNIPCQQRNGATPSHYQLSLPPKDHSQNTQGESLHSSISQSLIADNLV